MRLTAITFSKDAQTQMIYVFVVGSNQHLHAKYWNWAQPVALWADLGAPTGTEASFGGLSATTYYENGSQGKRRIHVFVLGQNAHLYVNYRTASQWKWADQGQGLTDPWGSSSVAFYATAKWRIYAFVATGGKFRLNYWNGTNWNWADQGKPANTYIFSTPSVITYKGRSGKRRIHAFGSSQDGHLYVNYWNGSAWAWVDLGTPPGTLVAQHQGAISKASPTAITFPKGVTQRIYVFVAGEDHHLYVKYWNGVKWAWADQGMPSGTTIDPAYQPSVITYLEGGKQRIYAFVLGANHHLYVNYWNGTQWNWADQGAPPASATFGGISAVTFSKSAKRHIYVFAGCSDGHVRVNHWDGLSWIWSDLGIP